MRTKGQPASMLTWEEEAAERKRKADAKEAAKYKPTPAEIQKGAEIERAIIARLRELAPQAEALRVKHEAEEVALRTGLFAFINENRKVLYQIDSIIVAKKTGLKVTIKHPKTTSIISLLQSGELESAGSQVFGFTAVGKRPNEDSAAHNPYMGKVLEASKFWLKPEDYPAAAEVPKVLKAV